MSVFTADFLTNHSDSIICETSSLLLLLVLFAGTKLNSRTTLESFLSLLSIFGYLGKETKNTAKHVIMKKFVIYARACVNGVRKYRFCSLPLNRTYIGQARALCYKNIFQICTFWGKGMDIRYNITYN